MHFSPSLSRRFVAICTVLLLSSGFLPAAATAPNPFVGRWALTLPGGAAGWLGVSAEGGELKASILWGTGSVLPVTHAKIEGQSLLLTRESESQQKDSDGKMVVRKSVEVISAGVEGDNLKLSTTTTDADAKVHGPTRFYGHRLPPIPRAPDVARVKFGEPVPLFNGKDLTGWKLMGHAPSGWSVAEGVLKNHTPQEPGKHKSYANIRTEKEFEDFNLKLEFRVPEDGNSGVYLRGIYEIQVANSYGKKNDPHNCGALYSRITPSENASKPPGEWQSYDITFVDQHLTVVFNGKRVIDNQPVLGCTGGALWSNESRPGPIYLQGDHSDVEYRNLVLRPVVK